MTGARFAYLKANPLAVEPHEIDEFHSLLAWEKRSNAAKVAVKTKRKRYTKWPTSRKDHKLR